MVDLGSAGHVGGEGEGIDVTPLATGRIHTLTIDTDKVSVFLADFSVPPPRKTGTAEQAIIAVTVAATLIATIVIVVVTRRRWPRRDRSIDCRIDCGGGVHIDFLPSERTSLGVEMELEIVDRETRELRSGASEILELMGAGHDGEHPKAKHELLESTIEIITGVCTTVPEARADLAATLDEVTAHTAPRGMELLCSGTHPFSDWADQDISPNPRYAQLVEEMQWLARRLQIFGIHVHVGVRSAEKAIAIANALSTVHPPFPRALGVEPLLDGTRHGARLQPLQGVRGPAHRRAPLPALRLGRVRGVHDDPRLRPVHQLDPRGVVGHPPASRTSAPSSCASATALPTLAEVGGRRRHEPVPGRAGSTTCIDRGYTLPVPRTWVVRENKWRAARHGVDAEIIIDEKGTLSPLRTEVSRLVEELAPVARRLGVRRRPAYALVMAERPSYMRQRDVVRRRRFARRRRRQPHHRAPHRHGRRGDRPASSSGTSTARSCTRVAPAASAFDVAVERVIGRPAGDHGVRMSGKTDPEIALEILAFAQVAEGEAREHLPLVLEHLEHELAAAVHHLQEHGRVMPGVVELLTRLHDAPDVVSSVLTGNIEPNGRLKVAAFGLDRWLDLDVGAYGSDDHDRNHLVPVALGQAGGRRQGRVVRATDVWVVGDTPRDLACARAGGARCLLVGTGRFPTEELRALGPDAAVDDLGDVDAMYDVLTGD